MLAGGVVVVVVVVGVAGAAGVVGVVGAAGVVGVAGGVAVVVDVDEAGVVVVVVVWVAGAGGAGAGGVGKGGAGGGGGGAFTPITDNIRAQVDVVVAEFSICALCCAVTALCIDIPMVSAITLLRMAMDCELVEPLSNCCRSATEESM